MKKTPQPLFGLITFSLLMLCLGSTVLSLGTFARLLMSIDLVPPAYAEQKTTTTTTIRARHAPTATRNAEEVRNLLRTNSQNSGPEHSDTDEQGGGSSGAVQSAAELIKQHKAAGN